MNTKINKKVKHIMTVACGSSAVDIDSNSLSILNVIEEITVSLDSVQNQPIDLSQKKGIAFPFEIVSIWGKLNNSDDVSTEIKIVLHDPDDVIMQELPYKLEIKAIHQRMRIRIKSNGLNITKQGNYYFSILLKSGDSFEEVGQVPLVIKITLPSDLKLLKK
jgi:hypothetical protein